MNQLRQQPGELISLSYVMPQGLMRATWISTVIVFRPPNHVLTSSPPILTFIPFNWFFNKTLSLRATAGNPPLHIRRESLILPIVALDASRWRSIRAKLCAGERFQSLRLKTDQEIQSLSLEKVLLRKEWLSALTWCTETPPHWVIKAVKVSALLVARVHALNALETTVVVFSEKVSGSATSYLPPPNPPPALPFLME